MDISHSEFLACVYTPHSFSRVGSLTCQPQTPANRSPPSLARSSPETEAPRQRSGTPPPSPPVFESSHHLNQLPGKLRDGNLPGGPHVVDFSRGSLFQQQEEGFDGVVHKQKVARYRTGSLDGAGGEKKTDLIFSLICTKLQNRQEQRLKLQFTNHFWFICRRVRNLGITWQNSRRILIAEVHPLQKNNPP